jgi:hypothetical protein
MIRNEQFNSEEFRLYACECKRIAQLACPQGYIASLKTMAFHERIKWVHRLGSRHH